MPDDHPLTLHQADQAPEDFALILDDLDFIKVQLARLPTRTEIARIAVLIALAASALGILGIEAFSRYPSVCNAT
jgi:hypothetical protein